MSTARPTPSAVGPVEGRAESRPAQAKLRPELPEGARYALDSERWAVCLDGPTRESYTRGRARDTRRAASLRRYAGLETA